jgi:uncharacterized protein YggE
MRPALLALVFAVGFGASALAQATASAGIHVVGVGEATAAPDMARLTLGATAEADAADSASGAASEIMARILAALREAGIADPDLRTVSIDLSPVYARGDAPTIIAWRARQRLEVVLRDVAALGPTLDAALAAGATDVERVQFDHSDQTALRDAARRAAVADAFASARLLAEAAGVALGQLQSLTLGGGHHPEAARAAVMADIAGATPVAPGTLSVSAAVSAVFAVE